MENNNLFGYGMNMYNKSYYNSPGYQRKKGFEEIREKLQTGNIQGEDVNSFEYYTPDVNKDFDILDVQKSLNLIDETVYFNNRNIMSIDTEFLPLSNDIKAMTELGFEKSIKETSNSIKANVALPLDSQETELVQDLFNKIKNNGLTYQDLTKKEQVTIQFLTKYSGDFNDRFSNENPVKLGNKEFPFYQAFQRIADPNDNEELKHLDTSIDQARIGFNNLLELTQKSEYKKDEIIKFFNQSLINSKDVIVGQNIDADLEVLYDFMNRYDRTFVDPKEQVFDLYKAISIAYQGEEEHLSKDISEIFEKDSYEVKYGLKSLDQMRTAAGSNRIAHSAMDDSMFVLDLLTTKNTNGINLIDKIKKRMNKIASNTTKSLATKGQTFVATNSIYSGPLDYILQNNKVVDFQDVIVSRNNPYTISSMQEISVKQILKQTRSKKSKKELKKLLRIKENEKLIKLILNDKEGNQRVLFRSKNAPFKAFGSSKKIESITEVFQNNFIQGNEFSSNELSNMFINSEKDKARRQFEEFFQPFKHGGQKQAAKYYQAYENVVEIANKNNENLDEVFEKMMNKSLDEDSMKFIFNPFSKNIDSNKVYKNIVDKNLSIDDIQKYNSLYFESAKDRLSFKRLVKDVRNKKGAKQEREETLNYLVNKASKDFSERQKNNLFYLRNVLGDTRQSIGNVSRNLNHIQSNTSKGYISQKIKDQILSQHYNLIMSDVEKHLKTIIPNDNPDSTKLDLVARNRKGFYPLKNRYNMIETIQMKSPFDTNQNINIDFKSVDKLESSLYSILRKGEKGTDRSNLDKVINFFKTQKFISEDYKSNYKISLHENVTKLANELNDKHNHFNSNAAPTSFDLSGFIVEGTDKPLDNFLESQMISSEKLQVEFDKLEKVYNQINSNNINNVDNVLKKANWSKESITEFKRGLKKWIPDGNPNGIASTVFFDNKGKLQFVVGNNKYTQKMIDMVLSKETSSHDNFFALIELPTRENVNGADIINYKGMKRRNVSGFNSYINKTGDFKINKRDTITESLSFLTKSQNSINDIINGNIEKAQSKMVRTLYAPLQEVSEVSGVSVLNVNGTYKSVLLPNVTDVQKAYNIDEFIYKGLHFAAKDPNLTSETASPESKKINQIFQNMEKRGLSRNKFKNADPKQIKESINLMNIDHESYIISNITKGDNIAESLIDYLQVDHNIEDDNLNEFKNLLQDKKIHQLNNEALIAKGYVWKGSVYDYQPFSFLGDYKRPPMRQSMTFHSMAINDINDLIQKQDLDFISVNDYIRTDKMNQYKKQSLEYFKKIELDEDLKEKLSKGITGDITTSFRMMSDEEINKALQRFEENVLNQLEHSEEAKNIALNILNKNSAEKIVKDDLINHIEQLKNTFKKISRVATTYEQHMFGSIHLLDDRLFGTPELHHEKIASDVGELTDDEISSLIGKTYKTGEKIKVNNKTIAVNKSFEGKIQEIKDGKISFAPIESWAGDKKIMTGQEKGMFSSFVSNKAEDKYIAEEMFQEIFGYKTKKGKLKRIGLIGNLNYFKHNNIQEAYLSQLRTIASYSKEKRKELGKELKEKFNNLIDLDDSNIVVNSTSNPNEDYINKLDSVIKKFSDKDDELGELLRAKDYGTLSVVRSHSSEIMNTMGEGEFGKGTKWTHRELQIGGLVVDVESNKEAKQINTARNNLNDYLMSEAIEDTSVSLEKQNDIIQDYKKIINANSRAINESTKEPIKIDSDLKVKSLDINEAYARLLPNQTSIKNMNESIFGKDFGDIIKIDLPFEIENPLPQGYKGINSNSTKSIYVPNISLGVVDENVQYNQIQNQVNNIIDYAKQISDKKIAPKEYDKKISKMTQNLYQTYFDEIVGKDKKLEQLYAKRLRNSGQGLLAIVPPEIENTNGKVQLKNKYYRELAEDAIEMTNGKPVYKDIMFASEGMLKSLGVDIEKIGKDKLMKEGLYGVGVRYPSFMDSSTRVMNIRLDPNMLHNERKFNMFAWTAKALNGDVDGDKFSFWVNLHNDNLNKHLKTLHKAQSKQNRSFAKEALESNIKLRGLTLDQTDFKMYNLLTSKETEDFYSKNNYTIENIHELRKEYDKALSSNNLTNFQKQLVSDVDSFAQDFVDNGHHYSRDDVLKQATKSHFYKVKAVGFASNPNYKLREIGLATFDFLTKEGKDKMKTLTRLFTNPTEESIISIKHSKEGIDIHWADQYGKALDQIAKGNKTGFNTIKSILDQTGHTEEEVKSAINVLEEMFSKDSIGRKLYNDNLFNLRKITYQDYEKQRDVLDLLYNGNKELNPYHNTTQYKVLSSAQKKVNFKGFKLNNSRLKEGTKITDGSNIFTIQSTKTKPLKNGFIGLPIKQDGNIKYLQGTSKDQIQTILNSFSPVPKSPKKMVSKMIQDGNIESLTALSHAISEESSSDIFKEITKDLTENAKKGLNQVGTFAEDVGALINSKMISNDMGKQMIRDFNKAIKNKAQRYSKKSKTDYTNIKRNILKKRMGEDLLIHDYNKYINKVKNIPSTASKNINKINSIELINFEKTKKHLQQEFINASRNVDKDISIPKMHKKIVEDNLVKINNINKNNIDIVNQSMLKLYTESKISPIGEAANYLGYYQESNTRSILNSNIDSLNDMKVLHGRLANTKFKDLNVDDIQEFLSTNIDKIDNQYKNMLIENKRYLSSFLINNENIMTREKKGLNMGLKIIEDYDLIKSKASINIPNIETFKKIKITNTTSKMASKKITENATDILTDLKPKNLSTKHMIGIGLALGVAAFALSSNLSNPKPLVMNRNSSESTPNFEGTYDDKDGTIQRKRTISPNSNFKKEIIMEKPGTKIKVSGTSENSFNQNDMQSIATASGLEGNLNVNFTDNTQEINNKWFENKITNLF